VGALSKNSNIYESFCKKSFYIAVFFMIAVPLLAVETPKVLSIIPIICTFFLLFNLSKDNFKPRKSEWVMFGYIGVFTLFAIGHSFVFSVTDDSIERVQKIIPLLFVGGVFLYLLGRSPKIKPDLICNLVMGVCGVAAVFVIIETTFDAPVYRYLRDVQDNPRYYGMVFNRGAVAIVAFFLTAFFLSNKKKTLFALGCLLAVILMCLNIESQSAQLGLIFGLLFFYAFPIKYKFFTWALLFVVLAYVVSFPFIIPLIFNLVPEEGFANPLLQQSYATYRLDIWDFVSRKIQENAVFGHGLEFSRGYTDFDMSNKFYTRDSILHPHNSILQIWIELGAVGVAFFMTMLANLYIFLCKRGNDVLKKTSITMLMFFMLLNSFSYGLWQGWWIGLMFLTSGLILLVSHQRDAYKES